MEFYTIEELARIIETLEYHEPWVKPDEIIEELKDYYGATHAEIMKAYRIARRHEIALERYANA